MQANGRTAGAAAVDEALAPGRVDLPPGRSCVLLKPGEIYLRGRNRERFAQRLHANLRDALRGVGGTTWIKRQRSVTVLGGEVPLADLVHRARRVAGFVRVQPAVRVPTEPDAIGAAAVALARQAAAVRADVTFAVRVRRRAKEFPQTSSRYAADLGALIQRATGLPVDLTAPEVEICVEIDHRESYVAWQRLAGQGGLPVGSSGRALVLLSGGFDSPVAAHRAMRRGLACDFVHFTGAPYTDPSSTYKAYALARELNRYQPDGGLHVVPLGRAQRSLAVAGAGKYQIVAQRRLMVRTAAALARRLGADALVAGDSLGQVASQTLTNLATVDEAADLPLLRPLIGWDKQEIIDEARAIGTAEISALPDEDCCRLLAPERVSTRARPPELHRIEGRLDVDETVEGLLRDARLLTPGGDGADEPDRAAAGEPGTDAAEDADRAAADATDGGLAGAGPAPGSGTADAATAGARGSGATDGTPPPGDRPGIPAQGGAGAVDPPHPRP